MGKKEPSLAEPIVVANGKKDSRVTLGPVLDIRAAAGLREGLQKALKRGKPVIIDAAQVDRLSTPCIQVLLAAGKSAEGGTGRIVLAQTSDAFVAAFSDLGLFANLMSWQAEA
jgi:anti-anti-sigma regulatory factor